MVSKGDVQQHRTDQPVVNPTDQERIRQWIRSRATSDEQMQQAAAAGRQEC